MSRTTLKTVLLFAATLGAGSVPAYAVTVQPDGSLTHSTSFVTVDNVLSLVDGAANGFAFSGATGDFSPTVSPKGYYYSAYLFSVGGSTAESVVTTLQNSSGVANLAERIYGFSGSFLGDAAAGTSIVQSWSTNLSLAGASISVIAPTALTAGQYVLEVRGTSPGVYGGSLSLITPIPEPMESAMLAVGFGMIGVIGRRRRKG